MLEVVFLNHPGFKGGYFKAHQVEFTDDANPDLTLQLKYTEWKNGLTRDAVANFTLHKIENGVAVYKFSGAN